MYARFFQLLSGYVSPGVASSVSLAVDGERVVVIDPGMVSNKELIISAIQSVGYSAPEVTDVIVSHLHLDHTMNVALFSNATVHDFMASYKNDSWENHEENFSITENITVVSTPGHTREDVSTFVKADSGLVVCTHLWWSSSGPEIDPYSYDQRTLESSRSMVLQRKPDLIVPGHGPSFKVSELRL